MGKQAIGLGCSRLRKPNGNKARNFDDGFNNLTDIRLITKMEIRKLRFRSVPLSSFTSSKCCQDVTSP